MKISGDFSSVYFEPGKSLPFGSVGGRGRTDSVVAKGKRASVVGREVGDVSK